jgi:hypothetical protein
LAIGDVLKNHMWYITRLNRVYDRYLMISLYLNGFVNKHNWNITLWLAFNSLLWKPWPIEIDDKNDDVPSYITLSQRSKVSMSLRLVQKHA